MVLNLGKVMGDNSVSVKCYSRSNRNGFSHHAEAFVNGKALVAKMCYINRTWEAYPFQSVLKSMCEKIAMAVYGVPSASALWKAKKWNGAREYASFLMAQV